MLRTTKYGISGQSIYIGGNGNAVYLDVSDNRLTTAEALPPDVGGTGTNSSIVSDGIPHVSGGVWTYGNITANDFGAPYMAGNVLSTNAAGILGWIIPPDPTTETVTIVNISPYTVLPSDMTLAVDTSLIPIIIDLPQITGPRRLTIIDSSGNTNENNITIRPYAGNTILRDSGNVIIATPNMGATFQAISMTDWSVISKN